MRSKNTQVDGKDVTVGTLVRTIKKEEDTGGYLSRIHYDLPCEVARVGSSYLTLRLTVEGRALYKSRFPRRSVPNRIDVYGYHTHLVAPANPYGRYCRESTT